MVTTRLLMAVQANISLKWEATHMNSSEGENIMFLSSTILEGPVEVRVYYTSIITVTMMTFTGSMWQIE